MHSMIAGKTMSGKTTWAKKKVKALKEIYPNRPCLVLDPFLDPGWEVDFKTSDPDEFLEVVWASENCNLFVDESGKMIGKFNPVMDQLATQSRHWGHKCYFISQRVKQISTNIRTQCSEVVLFKQSLNDTKDLADEFCEPLINQAHSLEPGEFIHVLPNEKPYIGNIFE